MEKTEFFLQIAQYSDRGTRLMDEDRIMVWESEDAVSVTLADGVGGHGGGSTAAAAVTGEMTEFFEKMQKDLEKGSDRQKPAEDDMREYLRLAFEKTNQTVLGLQTARCPLQATCVVLWLMNTGRSDEGWQAIWGHAGDSRLYLFVEGKLVLRTRDHSMAELRKSEPGVEGETFSRSVIWQAMGERDGVRPEISGLMNTEKKDTVFLLCSDGLWECVDEKAMEETLERSRTPDEWLEYLRKLLEKSGREAYDNHSAAAVFLNRGRR